MKSSHHLVGDAYDEAVFLAAFSEQAMAANTIRGAEHRATLVFDLLLTYLCGDELCDLSANGSR